MRSPRCRGRWRGPSARLAKIETLAAALREAGPLEVPIAVAYLSGELPQRQIGVGWAALRDGFAPAEVPTLTLSDVDSGFSAIGAVSGKGSAAARKALVGELFGRATGTSSGSWSACSPVSCARGRWRA